MSAAPFIPSNRMAQALRAVADSGEYGVSPASWIRYQAAQACLDRGLVQHGEDDHVFLTELGRTMLDIPPRPPTRWR
jgi:hypothetical protein